MRLASARRPDEPSGPGMRVLAFLLAVAFLPGGCRAREARVEPKVQFTRVPPADKGGPDTVDTIEGRVIGARPGQQIVLYARSGVWWAEPGRNRPFTPIRPDSTWSSSTHLGTEYAALLVEPDYRPPATADVLPKEGGAVVAVAVVPGDPKAQAVHHTLQFSGYEWRVRATPSDRGGRNDYDPANAFTDGSGALHLRITGAPGDWTCAEVSLNRSLGYGTYRFVVRDVSHLEPAAVLTFFTWDGPAADQNHREVDIEISRFGDPASKNAQYVIQPYYLAANLARFVAPPGVLTHSLRWEPETATFMTVRGSATGMGPRVAEHRFTSGVPSPGNEKVRMNLYAFHRSAQPLQKGAEVVIDKFEYFP